MEANKIAEQGGVEFKMIPVADIEANDYNPNDMDAEYFESLAATIKEEGVVTQTVLVRRKPGVEGRYIIVDGEHRWKAAQMAGLAMIMCAIVPLSEIQSKARTLSMNHLRGKDIPIKLARLIVDLQKEYTPEQIRKMTGINEDNQSSVLELLKVPTFSPQSTVHVSAMVVDRPLNINLMLLPDETKLYTDAMKKAMKLAGEDVTVLIGKEVIDYDKAIKGAFGIAGVKLRSFALAMICATFNTMTDEQRETAIKKAKDMIMENRMKDGQQKVDQAMATDHTVTATHAPLLGEAAPQ